MTQKSKFNLSTSALVLSVFTFGSSSHVLGMGNEEETPVILKRQSKSPGEFEQINSKQIKERSTYSFNEISLMENGDLLQIAFNYLTGNEEVMPNPLKAKETFKILSEKGCAEASYQLGMIYTQGYIGFKLERNQQKAIKYFKRAGDQGSIRAFYMLGAFCFDEKRKQDGIPYLQNGISLYESKLLEQTVIPLEEKQNVEKILLTLGNYSLEQKQDEQAKEYLQRALDLGNDQTSYFVGNIYYKNKRGDEALAHYEKALSSSPNVEGEIYFSMGKIYLAKNDFSQAKKCCELSHNAGQKEASSYLGCIYLKEMNNQLAREWFEKGISLNCSLAYLNLGLRLLEDYPQGSNEFMKGLNYLEKAIQERSHRIDVLCVIAESYSNLGDQNLDRDIELARKYFEKSAKYYTNTFLQIRRVKEYASTELWNRIKVHYNKANLALGTFYLWGRGVPEDRQTAYCHFQSFQDNGGALKDLLREYILRAQHYLHPIHGLHANLTNERTIAEDLLDKVCEISETINFSILIKNLIRSHYLNLSWSHYNEGNIGHSERLLRKTIDTISLFNVKLHLNHKNNVSHQLSALITFYLNDHNKNLIKAWELLKLYSLLD